MIECIGDNKNLIHSGTIDELVQFPTYRFRAADDCLPKASLYRLLFPRCPEPVHAVDRWFQVHRLIAGEGQKSLLRSGE